MADSPRVCNDITISGLDGTMTLAGTSIGLTVSGSLSFPATNLTRTYTGTTTFNATTTGKTITTNGVAFGGAVTFDGVGGAWTLGSAFSLGGSLLTVINGTFDTSVSNYAVTLGAFNSSNSSTRTINLNGSTLTLSGSWTMTNSTNATLNAGTSQITLSAIAVTFAGGGLTYNNISFTSPTPTTTTKSITGANTFNNVTFTAPSSSGGSNNISIGANQTINGTLTVPGTNGDRRLFVRSDTIGTSRTLTCAAESLTDVDFRDIVVAGAGSPFTGTRLGDCGGNTNITFDAGVDKYWNLAAGGNWNATAWALSSGGSVAAANFPLAQDTVIIENTGLNTSATITINIAYNIGTLNTSTRTNAMTLASGTINPIFYGNFTYGSGVTPTGTGTYTFSNRSTKTLNSGGKTFPQIININAPSGGIQLLTNNLSVSTSATLTQGTLNLNGLSFTVPSLATATGTKNITFNGGTLTISSSGATAFNNAAPTGFTTTAGTGTGTISMTSASAKTFVGGGSVYNCTLNQGGAGTLTITGANTFNDITETVPTANQITFPASTTTTVNNFTLSGTAGNLVSIRSSTPGTRFTLSKSSGAVSVSYVDIQDSNATGGATWQATTTNGNVDSGNNLGWSFISGTYVDASAAVIALADVSCLASRVRLFQGSVNASATVTAVATRLLMGQGSINCDATVTATGIRIRVGSGSVTGSAVVTAAPNFTASGNAAIAANAAVSAYANATFDSAPIITGNATISADGQIIGEEWGDSSVVTSTWDDISPSADTWQPASQSSNTWLRQ
jgi:hypothetical protein